MLRTSVGVAALLLLASSAGFSEVIEVPLPELAGSYASAGSRTTEFDVGYQLDSINAVYIAWRGSVTPGTGHGDGMWIPLDEWFDWPAQFYARMAPDPPQSGAWQAWVGSEGGGFDETTPFDSYLSPGWDFLLDGAAEIRVELAPAIFIGGVMVTPPTGYVSEATLVMDADFTAAESATWASIKSLYR
jgi:hypothetical protein